MKISVASGKGGTGKTTVAASLALSLVDQIKVQYLDCDVEAPNGHLYLKPEFTNHSDVNIQTPQIDPALCTGCGRCVEVCQYHALAQVARHILVFPQLCHGCGSCTWNCPEAAITETANPLGLLETGTARSGVQFSRGQLIVSEPLATPVIRQLKKTAPRPDGGITILDAPPGASCSVVETLRGSDFALLVTEPTPFGLHDLRQIIGIVDEMNIPSGIVINRDGIGDTQVEDFITESRREVLLRIPYMKQLASGIAAGQALIDILPEYRAHFQDVYRKIAERVKGGKQ